MRGDTCVHFRGLYHFEACEAGVNYRQLAGGDERGWACRLPCLGGLPGPKDGTARVECAHKRLPTPEEIAEEDAWVGAMTERHRKSAAFFKSIREKYKGESASGTDDCPACGTGRLSWRIAGYNGHVHARCTTPDCLNFME